MGEAAGDDLILPFMIETTGVRGRLVRLGPAVDAILARHNLPDAAAALLGELAALAGAMAGALKYDGIFTVQTKGDGPAKTMVADVTSDGALRAFARVDAAALAQAGARTHAPVPMVIGGGWLAFTVDQGDDTERYQGMVELDGATLADCMHHYFRQSEQVQAAFALACGQTASGWRAGALMLQQLPPLDASPEAAETAEEGWRRAVALMGSVSKAELLDPDLTADRLLYRLFHEDGVRVYPPQPLIDRCRCSSERVEVALRSLSEAELVEMTLDDGSVTATCEFCSRTYAYAAQALAAMRAQS